MIIAGQEIEYARQASAAAFTEIDRLELELSRFIEHSDISRINALKPGEWARLGPAALDCLLLARQVFTDTAGAFDITIGGILHAAKEAALGPAAVGMDLLEINAEYRAAGLRGGRVSIDLGAVGKGYAIDQAAQILAEWGIDRAIIHSGQSTALAIGNSSWPMSIRNPQDHDAMLQRISLPSGLALSGSGVKLHGQHIINPRTGAPVTDRLGAWAVAPSAAESDAISTAFMVMSAAEIELYCAAHPKVCGMTLSPNVEAAQARVFGRWSDLVIPTLSRGDNESNDARA